jgi:hypothetical protein
MKRGGDTHGDLPVLLICDNLKAHLNPRVKEIFGNANIFLFCLPPNITESLQPIDAAYGRSLRLAIGRLLDQWLMIDDNLQSWEGKMKASERRVLMTNLVAAATEECLKNDDMRVGCFQRTGCLMELHKAASDDLIKPQGVKSKIVIPDQPTNIETTTPVPNESEGTHESAIEAEDATILEGDAHIGDNDITVELDDEENAEDEAIIDDDEEECIV